MPVDTYVSALRCFAYQLILTCTFALQNLRDKKELLVSGLRPVLVDRNIKVRSTMAQLIMALASHDYLRLEGGSTLVQFLVDQCNISDEEIAKVSLLKNVPQS